MAILYELLAGRPERPTALGDGPTAAEAAAPTIGQPA
jgi:hypothetical protein